MRDASSPQPDESDDNVVSLTDRLLRLETGTVQVVGRREETVREVEGLERFAFQHEGIRLTAEVRSGETSVIRLWAELGTLPRDLSPLLIRRLVEAAAQLQYGCLQIEPRRAVRLAAECELAETATPEAVKAATCDLLNDLGPCLEVLGDLFSDAPPAADPARVIQFDGGRAKT